MGGRQVPVLEWRKRMMYQQINVQRKTVILTVDRFPTILFSSHFLSNLLVQNVFFVKHVMSSQNCILSLNFVPSHQKLYPFAKICCMLFKVASSWWNLCFCDPSGVCSFMWHLQDMLWSLLSPKTKNILWCIQISNLLVINTRFVAVLKK